MEAGLRWLNWMLYVFSFFYNTNDTTVLWANKARIKCKLVVNFIEFTNVWIIHNLFTYSPNPNYSQILCYACNWHVLDISLSFWVICPWTICGLVGNRMVQESSDINLVRDALPNKLHQNHHHQNTCTHECTTTYVQVNITIKDINHFL